MDLTLLVCTFNRSQDLTELLRSAVAQQTDGSFTYEVLVVDNNSTDNTRGVVEFFIQAGHQNIRYLFEGKQGKSNALNSGLVAARGWAYAITDDDFILPPDWVKQIIHGFRAHSDVSFVSGKVLPRWYADPPLWVGPDHWSPLALADYGDETFYVDEHRQVCLLACAFRSADVQAVGGYRPDLSVTENSIGGVEDLDILQRLWKSGRRGVYLPTIWFLHKVPKTRLVKSYHRRWHAGHGRFYAALADDEFERSAAYLFGVPAHLYKQSLLAVLRWIKWTLLLNPSRAFANETKIWFSFGFFSERHRIHTKTAAHGAVAEVLQFAAHIRHFRRHNR